MEREYRLMKNYIFAETLKHKHSFLLKILFIAPIISLLVAFVLMPLYFSVNACDDYASNFRFNTSNDA